MQNIKADHILIGVGSNGIQEARTGSCEPVLGMPG